MPSTTIVLFLLIDAFLRYKHENNEQWIITKINQV